MIQDSFAIYASNKCETDIHINVWTNIKSINYIDIGLRIYRRKQFRTISIYIPFHISQSEIWDLSEILKDETVMRGIFNEKCSISISSTKEYYDVKLNKCSMRVLSINSCLINIDKLENGTIITFFISQWSKNNIAYIRFRLPYKSLSYYLLSKKHIYLEALESPIIKEKYFYNFKLNEGRTLPKQILSNINDLVVTRKINFFLCIPDKYSIKDEKIYKVRMIENNIFGKYIPHELFKKNSIIYQWRYSKNTKCTLSTLFERKYINWISVIFYSTAIIVLNILSSFLFQLFSNIYKILAK